MSLSMPVDKELALPIHDGIEILPIYGSLKRAPQILFALIFRKRHTPPRNFLIATLDKIFPPLRGGGEPHYRSAYPIPRFRFASSCALPLQRGRGPVLYSFTLPCAASRP